MCKLNISITCPSCGSNFDRPKHRYDEAVKKGWVQCCSKDCRAKFKQKGKNKKCFHCNQDIYVSLSELKKSKSGDHFCSKRCSTIVNNSRHKKWKNHPNYLHGISSYRQQALNHYPNICHNKMCPIKQTIPTYMLDVHHIDGDRKNNKMTNLQILCVWCHALETRKYQNEDN